MRIKSAWASEHSARVLGLTARHALLSDGSAIDLESGANGWKSALLSAAVGVGLPGGDAALIDHTGQLVRVDGSGKATPGERLPVAELGAFGPRAAWVSARIKVVDGAKWPPAFFDPLPLAKVIELTASGTRTFELPPRHSPVALFSAGRELVVLCDETLSLEEDPNPSTLLFSDQLVAHHHGAEVSAVGDGSVLITVEGERHTWLTTAAGAVRGEFAASPDNAERFAISADVLVSVNCTTGHVRRLDVNGTAQWSRESSGFKKPLWSIAPVLSAGACWFVGPGGKLVAFEVATGEPIALTSAKVGVDAVIHGTVDGVVVDGESLTRWRVV